MNINRGNPVVRDPNFRPNTEPSARMLETLWRSVTGMTGRNGVTVEHRPSGGIVLSGTGAVYKSMLEIYDLTTTSYKIRSFKIGTNQQTMAIVAGELVNIAGSSDAFDTAITLTAAAFVYVKDAIAGSTVHTFTLEHGASVPTGGDISAGVAAYYWPLWYIAWDSTNSRIDTANTFDLRHFLHLPGYGN